MSPSSQAWQHNIVPECSQNPARELRLSWFAYFVCNRPLRAHAVLNFPFSLVSDGFRETGMILLLGSRPLPIVEVSSVLWACAIRRQILARDAIEHIVAHENDLALRIPLIDQTAVVVVVIIPCAHIRIGHLFFSTQAVINKGRMIPRRVRDGK